MPDGTNNTDQQALCARWVNVPDGNGGSRLEMVWATGTALSAPVPVQVGTDISADTMPRQRERLVA